MNDALIIPITTNPPKKASVNNTAHTCINFNISQCKAYCFFLFEYLTQFRREKKLNFIHTQQKNQMFFDTRICGLNIYREVFVYPPIPLAKFSVTDWKIQSSLAQGCRTGPPAYVACRTSTATYPESTISYSQGPRICLLLSHPAQCNRQTQLATRSLTIYGVHI